MHRRRTLAMLVVAVMMVGASSVSVGATDHEHYYRLVPEPEGLCWFMPANTPVWNETPTDLYFLSFQGPLEWNYPPESGVVRSVFAPPGNLINESSDWAFVDPDGDSGSDVEGDSQHIPAAQVSVPFDAVFRLDLSVSSVLVYRAEVTMSVGPNGCVTQGGGSSVPGTPVPTAFAEQWFDDTPLEPTGPAGVPDEGAIETPVEPADASPAQGSPGEASEPASPVGASPQVTG